MEFYHSSLHLLTPGVLWLFGVVFTFTLLAAPTKHTGHRSSKPRKTMKRPSRKVSSVIWSD
jgi:hypothetical protein